MPSDIPRAREIVLDVLEGRLPTSSLHEALALMTRDKAIRHAKTKHNAVTKEVRDAVRRDYADPRYADLSREDMARRYNLAGGRITEIEQGKYNSL